MARGLQSTIDALLKQGKAPKVTFLPGTEIANPRHPLHRGRQRVRPIDDPWSVYKGRRGKARPRCLARGCKHELQVKQIGACSPACADAVFNHALFLLRNIEATPEEILEHYRGVQSKTA